MSTAEFSSPTEKYKRLSLLERGAIRVRLLGIGVKDALNHPETFDWENGYRPTREAISSGAEVLASKGVDVNVSQLTSASEPGQE